MCIVRVILCEIKIPILYSFCKFPNTRKVARYLWKKEISGYFSICKIGNRTNIRHNAFLQKYYTVDFLSKRTV